MAQIPVELVGIYQALYAWYKSKTNLSYAIDVGASASTAVIATGQLNVYTRIVSYFSQAAEDPAVAANAALATALQTLITTDLTNDSELNKLDGTSASTNAGTQALAFADKYKSCIEATFVSQGFRPPVLTS